MPFVLIVEDEQKLAKLLEDYLRAAGFETQSIADGREVLPSLQRRRPDIILLDLMLPGKGGLEVFKEVRAEGDTPVIMVTALVEEVDRLIGLELGADDYICKPYSPREVVARVKAVLRRGQRCPGRGGAMDSFWMRRATKPHSTARCSTSRPWSFGCSTRSPRDPGASFRAASASIHTMRTIA